MVVKILKDSHKKQCVNYADHSKSDLFRENY